MPRTTVVDPDRFLFRGLHPDLYVGTTSDRYAGWIGQIYSEAAYAGRIHTRSHQIGGRTFKEQVLPVESVDEYFEHFRVLEVDYTFYSPLLTEDGEPTRTYHVLQEYRNHLTAGDLLILKVPQSVVAQTLWRGGKSIDNPNYLNADLFTRSFYEPAVELLGASLRGMIFEQEYRRKQDRLPVEEFVAGMSRFFDAIPADNRYHIELRTESYLAPEVFGMMENRGIGQVLSHWTWLPPLRKQLLKAENRFFSAANHSIVRLLTPLGMRYEDAYARAHPFDRLIEGMLQPRMIEEAAAIMQEGIQRRTRMHVLVNNRSGGNAPLIAREIAKRFQAMQSGNEPSARPQSEEGMRAD